MSDLQKAATDAVAGMKAEGVTALHQAEAQAAELQNAADAALAGVRAQAPGFVRRNGWVFVALAVSAVVLVVWFLALHGVK